jgi:two-component system chemotaxis sensor kinase CheA
VELLRLEAHQVESDVTVLDGAPVLRLRGNLLPLVDFADVLGVEKSEKAEGEIGIMNIAVLQTDDTPFGLVVDGVVDTQEIVVKPLGKQVKSVNIFSGATIMGDGRVALIVDVAGIGKLGRILREVTSDHGARVEEKEVDTGEGTKQTLLIVQVGDSGRVALPLQTIDRLEEFDPSVVEWAGGQPVVQYRGFIMPLIWLSSAVGVAPGGESSETYQVVVHTMNGRSVGVVVDAILDITEERVKIDAYSARLGVLGSSVISEKVTEVVDLSVIIGEFVPETESLGV